MLSGVSPDTLQVQADIGAGARRPVAGWRREERLASLGGHRKGQAASFPVWSRPQVPPSSRNHLTWPRLRSPRPAALTCEPRPGPSITTRARPAAAPAQSGDRRSASTPQRPLAHFRLSPRPPNCAHLSAANPPREANPRLLSHGGGTFSPLENSGSSPPSAPPPLGSFLQPLPWHPFKFPL